ncbi:histidine phosphatase family protein [Oceanibium sediminis]|uniref:histidine phosphatase family protein n=1 Tax=Oceanibium sediminis TaxID=2026339 RepID=UPI000DD4DF98|nr:histidine phosphatase family protein [Oceanibium sediminis]
MGLTLIRHPRVVAPGLCYGRHDPPLAPGWGADVRRLAHELDLGPARPPAIVSSPAERALTLAEGLADALTLPLSTDPRLQELDFGAWEGRCWQDIPRTESDPWAEDPETLAPPGGESFNALKQRVAAALADAEGAVVVTHAGPIRAAWILSGAETFATAFARSVPYTTALPCGDLR